MHKQLKNMEDSFFEQLKFEIELNKVKDELFQMFCQRLNETRTQLRNAATYGQAISRNLHNMIGRKYASAFEQNVLCCLEEKWTFLIKYMEDYIRNNQCRNIKESEQYKSVFSYVNVSSKFFNIYRVKDFVSNSFFATQIGFYFLTERNDIKQAEEYFKLAIELDNNFCAGAHVGMASCKVKGENKLKNKNDVRKNKTSTLNEFCNALRLVNGYMSVIEDELSKFNANAKVSRLYNNLIEKQLALKVFTSSLASNIELVRNSQCLMNLTVKHDEENATRVENFDDLEETLRKIQSETSQPG
jgi:hypothetical protein